jgi:hypothetical protein
MVDPSTIARTELSQETWRCATEPELVVSFLLSEWDRVARAKPSADKRLVTEADKADSRENQMRLKMLLDVRGPLIHNIPKDTQWFAVQFLRPHHLDELHAIHYPDWNDAADMNELRKVATRKREVLRAGSIQSWEPILWSHDRRGPFTILEGNHRLTALAGLPEVPFEMRTYVGLSPQKCQWHRLDW